MSKGLWAELLDHWRIFSTTTDLITVSLERGMAGFLFWTNYLWDPSTNERETIDGLMFEIVEIKFWMDLFLGSFDWCSMRVFYWLTMGTPLISSFKGICNPCFYIAFRIRILILLCEAMHRSTQLLKKLWSELSSKILPFTKNNFHKKVPCSFLYFQHKSKSHSVDIFK